MGHIERTTRLPDGRQESDSHHSFSLALIAYHIVKSQCLELDAEKVVLYALAHDLIEIITGDENTLHFTPEQFTAKQELEKASSVEFDKVFDYYPELRAAMYDYEKLDSPEAAAIFVLDKACTTWTHHPYRKEYAEQMKILKKSDVRAWRDRQYDKVSQRLKVQPPQIIWEVFEQSFNALEDMYDS